MRGALQLDPAFAHHYQSAHNSEWPYKHARVNTSLVSRRRNRPDEPASASNHPGRFSFGCRPIHGPPHTHRTENTCSGAYRAQSSLLLSPRIYPINLIQYAYAIWL